MLGTIVNTFAIVIGCKETGQNRKGEPALNSPELGVFGYNLGFQKSPKCPFYTSVIPKKVKTFETKWLKALFA